MTEIRILVVEDEIPMAYMIKDVLHEAGYTAILAHTAEDGLRLAFQKQPNIALLDVMVPAMGGWELCKSLRLLSSDMPIIFLTAMGGVDDVVKGLEMGADDYLVKPFKERELIARVKAQLRRIQPDASSLDVLVLANGEFQIDLRTRIISVEGREIELTPREFDLLSVLAKNAGRVVPSRELTKQAWGMSDKDALINLKPYIHYLRKKLEKDSASPRWILTARGIGYRLSNE